ncbi:MAG: DUF58 domain-containing protein [Planctomycetaceae bacterium]
MRKTEPGGLRPSFSLSAGALTQLLAAVACFLGAYVLPLTVPEFEGQSGIILLILGTVMLVLGVVNVLFGRRMSRVLARAGRRSRVVVPREGMAYLAIMLVLAVGALLGHRNMPLLVFGMMAGPFVMNGWIVYAMLKGVTVSRRAPRRGTVGEFLGVEIEVANAKRVMASHMLEVRDRINGDALKNTSHDEEGSVTFVRVPGRERRIGRYQVRFTQRGLYRLGPLRISSRFPLGIGERGQLFNDTFDLIVHPEQGRLLPAWKRQQRELAESSRRVQGRLGLFDDEFHRIREFRQDDNPRSIHWRSSAKRGQLMVREYQQQRHADSLVVLDLPAESEWSAGAMEMAISLAATLCVEQTRSASGKRFLLAIAGQTQQIVNSRAPSGFREEALDALAVCRPSAKADPEKVLMTIIQEHNLYDERILLITPRTQFAFDVLQRVTDQVALDSVNLVSLTTIVEGDPASMQKIFLPGLTGTMQTEAAV